MGQPQFSILADEEALPCERVNCITKVLDFVQLGGPVLAVGGAIFEMRVG